METIKIRGLRQNNLKNIDLDIPKKKIVVFTGVSGSGKSSIVFDTIAAESQRQMNETYSTWIRGRLPKYEKPNVDFIDDLNPSVIIDQSRLGGNARSTVGTISELYTSLRLLFSRIAENNAGPASYYSFNNPNGMCPVCCGIGKVLDLDVDRLIDPQKSFDEGCFMMPAFGKDKYYWKLYRKPEYFRPTVAWKDLTDQEQNYLLYGSFTKDGARLDKRVEGVYNQFKRLVLMKSAEEHTDHTMKKIAQYVVERPCESCGGNRLNAQALAATINGHNINYFCNLEFTELRTELTRIIDPRAQTIVEEMIATLNRLIDIGLPYLSLDRETTTLSGGEAQRLKLVRYMGSSLTGLIYIFDEPSTGLHPRDVYRMSNLLKSLRDKGNTVLVVEHDRDIIAIADEVIDIGPLSGIKGGEVLFQGSYADLLKSATKTGQAMRTMIKPKAKVRVPKSFLRVENATLHNLKNVSVAIPTGVLCAISGVAGSGKSTLIREVFAKKYADEVVLIDQGAITATGRSNVCTYLGFFDEIRKLFGRHNKVSDGLFSFNGQGACPVCKGRGHIVTELIFMDPVKTVCESCGGSRYSKEALSYLYKGKNIEEVLKLSVMEALDFFEDQPKILKKLQSLNKVGLDYIALGQPFNTFSGGERQRVKLAANIDSRGNIYILDEPTTGLHAADIVKIMKIFDDLVDASNTVIVIEHNQDVLKLADYIIDVGPDGGSRGGEIVFSGTPQEMISSSTTITAEYLRKSLL